MKIANKTRNKWKPFPLNSSSIIWARAIKLYRVIALIELKNPNDFGFSRLKVKITVTRRVKTFSAQLLEYPLTQSLQTS